MSFVRRLAENFGDVPTFGFSALYRHIARLRSDSVVHTHVEGTGRIYFRAAGSDFSAIRQVFRESDYDISCLAAVQTRVRTRYEAILAEGKTPIIVDAGANIGAASLWFHREYPQARIAAVEPEPANAEMLRRNVAGKPQITVMQAAIGATPGFASLAPHLAGWSARTARAEAGLPVVTIEDCFHASGGDTPFIVKIDIEGFEKDLFACNLDWIEQCDMVIIEPHDWMLPGQNTSHAFQAAMGRTGFEIFMRGENLIYVKA